MIFIRTRTAPAHRLAAAVCAVALALVLLPATSSAAEEAAETASTEILRIQGDEGTVFTVEGHGRFTGTIEVRPAPDGQLTLINELGMDAYIEGLAEVPASWPVETLKAQAVAARTYAWSSVLRRTFHDRGLGFDICATVACQVFHGREIVEGYAGDRWAQAVAETAGEVLAYEDAPILARYFSSSGGHTRNNEHVFGPDAPEGPRPYLVGVADPHEDISPHHRWSIQLTRDELNELLSHGETLHAAVPAAGVERVLADGSRVDQIRAIGEDGTVVEVPASQFRTWVSEVGPSVLPHRFPGTTADGDPLPQGLPSSRVEFDFRDDDTVIVRGRGWGHGVGMSQWGARGKAEAGFTHDQILAAYYSGLEPERHPAVPDEVRVGLTWEASTLEITADGPHTVVLGEHQATTSSGAWSLEADDTAGFTATGPSGLSWGPVPPPPAADEVPEVTEDADVPDEVPPADRGPRAVEPAETDGGGWLSRLGSVLRSGGLFGWLLGD